jgi:hypothetical protein
MVSGAGDTLEEGDGVGVGIIEFDFLLQPATISAVIAHAKRQATPKRGFIESQVSYRSSQRDAKGIKIGARASSAPHLAQDSGGVPRLGDGALPAAAPRAPLKCPSEAREIFRKPAALKSRDYIGIAAARKKEPPASLPAAPCVRCVFRLELELQIEERVER